MLRVANAMKYKECQVCLILLVVDVVGKKDEGWKSGGLYSGGCRREFSCQVRIQKAVKEIRNEYRLKVNLVDYSQIVVLFGHSDSIVFVHCAKVVCDW